MRKTYTLQELDCANCAAKIEAKFNALPQVEAATIVFATRQLHLTAQDPDALIPQLQALGRTVESGFTIATGEHSHEHHCHDQKCHCGHEHHHHDHEHHHVHKKKRELPGLLAGAGLFVLGLVLEAFLPPVHIGAFVAAYMILGWSVLTEAGKNLRKGHVFDENFLMGIATLGAFAIGEFPEAVGIMLFYRIGEYFEHRAVERSRSQIMSAVDLRPETVTLLSGQVIPAAEAKIGDVLLVRPGDRVPLDGVVLSGQSRIDTAPITGEPVPVGVSGGSNVISGCVNLSGQLTVRVEKPLQDSMVTRILRSVEEAAASKPKIDRFITRFAKVYTPVVVLLALATAVIPSLISGNWGYWVYTALSFLVMSCPCALVLSVPLAFFSGIGAGSRQGILFKGGLSMEALANIKAVVMDKTGTLTYGDFTVLEGSDELLALCGSCEQSSSHPIAQSVVAEAKKRNLILKTPEALEEIPGHGIRAQLAGDDILCGNEKLMKKFAVSGKLPESGCGTRILVAKNDRLLGTLVLGDRAKEEAPEAVRRLHSQGLHTVMLTGDRAEGAKAVAEQLEIRETHAQLLPEEKLQKLRLVRESRGAVMFVGDGINDAPVLAGADVGAAMGTGADAAIEAADVVFMTAKATAIPEALDIARRTKAIAWQNVIFALAIKLAVMALGLLGSASMWAAVFADSGVAMLCVLNSIRLLYRKKDC